MIGSPLGLEQAQAASGAASVSFFEFGHAGGAGGLVRVEVHHRIRRGQLVLVHALALSLIQQSPGIFGVRARDREPEFRASAPRIAAWRAYEGSFKATSLQDGAGLLELG
jgi:hypothetical protein